VLGRRPVAAIVFAQAANGILLPIVAVFLLVVVNRKDILRKHANGVVANILGIVVILIAAGLGAFQVLKAAGVVAG
jgi:manganese transport protein